MTRLRRVPIDRAAPLFAALGDETRLAIVLQLGGEGPQSIARLADGLEVSLQEVTRHLEALAEAGLASSRWRGRERVWEVQRERLDEARRHLEQIAERWDAAMEGSSRMAKGSLG